MKGIINFWVLLFISLPSIILAQENMQVEGAITLSDSNNQNPNEGTIRWNTTTNDFEGYTGSAWVSLTGKGSGWGKNLDLYEDQLVESDNLMAGDYFGWNIASEGDLLAVGSYRGAEGVVHIFKKNNDTWEQIFEVLPSDLDNREFFGRSLGISGNYIIVGVDGQSNSASSDVGNGVNSGSAYIFYYDGTNLIEETRLYSPGASSFDDYGKTVDIDGDIAAVSATGNTIEAGKVYMYQRYSSGWTLRDSLEASDGFAGNYFGRSVSIDGNNVLVGADANDVGKAYVYKRIGAFWSDETILEAAAGASNDYFGYSVALSGNTALIGAFGWDVSGAAYVFKNVNNTWLESSIITPTDYSPGSKFGIGVSFENGVAVIRASSKSFENVSNQGAAYVFCENPGSWILQAVLKSENGQPYDSFGQHVVVSGEQIFCAARRIDTPVPNTNSGGVFVFNK